MKVKNKVTNKASWSISKNKCTTALKREQTKPLDFYQKNRYNYAHCMGEV